VEGGRWKVEGGRWKVEGGRWKVEGGRGGTGKESWKVGAFLELESKPIANPTPNRAKRPLEAAISMRRAA
jgi:hypothetical protein